MTRVTHPSDEEIKRIADRAEGIADDLDRTDIAPPARVLVWPEQDGRSNSAKPLKGSFMNVRYAVDVLELQCRYEEFCGEYQIDDPLLAEMPMLGKFTGKLDDMIVRKFREVCFDELQFSPTKEATFDGLQRACEEHRFNAVTDYLTRCKAKWDKKKRVATWLTKYVGAEDTPLHREWGRIFLSAVVRRPFNPGLKFDSVLVLEGPENAGKSNVFKILASGKPPGERPKYFSDAPILKADTRKQQELTKGVLIYEIAELAHMQGHDQHLIKAFITSQEEQARAAYAHFQTNQARVCVFGGTFNTDANTGQLVEYLNAGDRRRWWGLPVGLIDFMALYRDRDQLLGEAMHDTGKLYLEGELYQAAIVIAQEREVTDVIVDKLAPLYREIMKPRFGANTAVEVNSVYGTEGDDFQIGDNRGMGYGAVPSFELSGRHVWVSSNFVNRIAVTGGIKDNRAPKRAMSSLGWLYRFERRPGYSEKVRGYVKPIIETDEPDEFGL